MIGMVLIFLYMSACSFNVFITDLPIFQRWLQPEGAYPLSNFVVGDIRAKHLDSGTKLKLKKHSKDSWDRLRDHSCQKL